MSSTEEISVKNDETNVFGPFCCIKSKREIDTRAGGIITKLQVRIRNDSYATIIALSGDENVWMDAGGREGTLYIGKVKVQKLMMDTRNWVIAAVSEKGGEFYIALDEADNSFFPLKDSNFFRFSGLSFQLS